MALKRVRIVGRAAEGSATKALHHSCTDCESENSKIFMQAGHRPGAIPEDQAQTVEGVLGIQAVGEAEGAHGPDGVHARVEHSGTAISKGRSATAAIIRNLHGERPEVGSSEPFIPLAAARYITDVNETKLTIVGNPWNREGEQFNLGNLDSPRFAGAFFNADERITASAVEVGGPRTVHQLRSAIVRGSHVSDVQAQAGPESAGRPR